MKLAMTLRHLATRDRYATLQYDFRVARTTIGVVVREVCDALVMELKHDVIDCWWFGKPVRCADLQPVRTERMFGTGRNVVGFLLAVQNVAATTS
ncbi:hypothetical protein DPMN_062499 [Dreissena polymorpha]|uniref:Uncharacterized protein n=1 Tax=Dreissena polymorpha TaxID=45954 RepID=A0A9D4C9N5_DREPO|nr:hypothetical protein DPMN_062499 [Dreissena polymorpha]